MRQCWQLGLYWRRVAHASHMLSISKTRSPDRPSARQAAQRACLAKQNLLAEWVHLRRYQMQE